MRKTLLRNISIFFSVLAALTAFSALAKQVQNTNIQPPALNPPLPSNSYSTSNSGIEPGTYSVRNPDGTYNQVYTTGDKKPYIVDNNSNQQPILSPEINIQSPNSNGYSGNNNSGHRHDHDHNHDHDHDHDHHSN